MLFVLYTAGWNKEVLVEEHAAIKISAHGGSLLPKRVFLFTKSRFRSSAFPPVSRSCFILRSMPLLVLSTSL